MTFSSTPGTAYIRDGLLTPVSEDLDTPANNRPLPVKIASSVTVESRPSGLNIAGRITEVSITDNSWTALPATPLADRNAMAIQNYSGGEIKLNYDNATVGYEGVIIRDGNERQYDIGDSILLYARSSTGTVTIIVEEIS